MAGWIKIYRDLQEHWLSQDFEKLGWWVDLLLSANHKDNKVLVKNQLVELQKGQMIVSLSFLAERWGKSKRTILKFLELLESEQMIARKSNRKVTILTICNYDGYQGAEIAKVTDTCTDKYPMSNRCVTETKNEEECKEIYNTPTAHTYTREDEFISKYRREGRWPEACLILHLKSVEECEHLFDRWILEYQHKGQTHSDYTDFKGHFIQWARITIQKEKKQNGDNSKTSQRRGVQVVANSPEDYQGPF